MVLSDAVLSQLCEERLEYTQQMIGGADEDEKVNQFLDFFLEESFLQWRFFFRSAAILLIAMQMLADYKHVLVLIGFELGNLGSYVYLAILLEKEQKNKFSFVEIVDAQKDGALSVCFEGVWNPDIDPDRGQPNPVDTDTCRENKIFIKGPNENGKTTYAFAVGQALLLAQVFGIAPCRAGRIGSVHFFYMPIGVSLMMFKRASRSTGQS